MAMGKTHDRFNFIIGSVLGLFFFFKNIDLFMIGFFIGGWFFSTYFFSPDADLMPKRRTGLAGVLLYPYSVFFKHRGLSHHWVLGPLSRILYLFIVTLFLVFLLFSMGHISLTPEGLSWKVFQFIKGFNFEEREYLYMVWLLLGFWGADLCHFALDRLHGIFRKLVK